MGLSNIIQQLFNTNDGKKTNERKEDPSINLKYLGEAELSIWSAK